MKFLFGSREKKLNKKKAFTYVEVIMVMVLISFLWVLATKVIKHNNNSKVPLYVYFLYKNLDKESKFITQKLSKENDGKKIEDVLKTIDAKQYCEVISKDLNLIGKIDCETSAENKILAKQEKNSINYTCTRDYIYKIDNNGDYSEIKRPTSSELECVKNEIYENILTCKTQPSIKIPDLAVSNNDKLQNYACIKDETPEEFEEIDVFEKPQNILSTLKTANNMHFYFVSLEKQNGVRYNLYANITQDAICPIPPQALISNVSYTPNQENYYCKYENKEEYKNYYCNCQYVSQNFTLNTSSPYKGSMVVSSKTIIINRNTNLAGAYNIVDKSKDIALDNVSNVQNCQKYIEYAQKYSNSETYNTNSIKNAFKSLYIKRFYTGASSAYYPGNYYYYIGGVLNLIVENENMFKEYYKKWTNFFNNNSTVVKKKIDAMTNLNINEGLVEKPAINREISNNLIYVSIDTPFEKGEMDKNIFIFEQFGEKIIPVGYLANNANSPLKFDVLTRDINTFKIQKLNNKPLTYCEAMKYTGEKFSQYCGCKDENNNNITQYTQNPSCDNKLGCIIIPVRPSSSGRFR